MARPDPAAVLAEARDLCASAAAQTQAGAPALRAAMGRAHVALWEIHETPGVLALMHRFGGTIHLGPKALRERCETIRRECDALLTTLNPAA